MNCPEHDATLAWIHGVGDEHHAEHVATCPVCAAELEVYERVAHALVDVAPALRMASPVRPARSPFIAVIVALAIAAAALIAIIAHRPADPAPPQPVFAAVSLDDQQLDAALDDLDGDMLALSHDLDAL